MDRLKVGDCEMPLDHQGLFEDYITAQLFLICETGTGNISKSARQLRAWAESYASENGLTDRQNYEAYILPNDGDF